MNICRRLGVFFDVVNVVGDDLVGDTCLRRVAAAQVILDGENATVLFSRSLYKV